MSRPKISIAIIVSIGLVAATTLLLGILGVTGYNYYHTQQWEEFRQRHTILTDQLATSLTLPLWNFDREQIGKVSDSAMTDNDVYAVMVASRDAALPLYARTRDANWKLQPVSGPLAAAGLLAERRNIVVADETLGRVEVFVTSQFLESRLRQALVAIIGAICLLDLILIVGLYLLLWRTVLRPLQEVERYAVAVSTGSQASDSLRGRSYLGELDSLRRAVEKMVSLLEARYAEREQTRIREQEARREFTRKLIASQETERRRIASELHDSLGQNLLLIKNRAQLALAQKNSPAELGPQMESIAELVAQAIAEVRQISHDLRPYQLDQLGLTRALQAMIDSAATSTTIGFKCKLEPVDDVFSAGAAIEVYRVVQESLTNIMKHSAAKHVRIELERDVHQVRLWIEDDGRGFEDRGRASTGIATGFGLQNMAERVGMLGGQLVIDSAPGTGTRIEVIVTIPNQR